MNMQIRKLTGLIEYNVCAAESPLKATPPSQNTEFTLIIVEYC